MSLTKPNKKKSVLAVVLPDTGATPLSRGEFNELMNAIAAWPLYPQLAIAVSGGADSMALLLLAHEWAQTRRGNIIALTVNHGLRAEAGNEAAQVSRWCQTLGIQHTILRWTPPKLKSAIQQQARDARYRLLNDWCHENHVPYLLTAHHRDDQAETLFFRLARGSGLDGLACMQPHVSLHRGITLARPLLPIAKTKLIATLRAQKHGWLEDSSNADPHYTRNRIRAYIANCNNAEHVCERAYQLTVFFALWRKQLELRTANKLGLCVRVIPQGGIIIDTEAFMALEPEYAKRVVISVAKHIGKSEYPPRSAKLERFYRQLYEDMAVGSTKSRSFSRCIFRPYPQESHIVVTAEKGRVFT